MGGVFISYARSDELKASALTDRLRALGYAVWRDDQLPGHRAYADVIEEQLKAADAVVVLWSASAAKSQWVRAEADAARQEGKLVQLTLDGSAPPMPFNQIHCIDFDGWTGGDTASWKVFSKTLTELADAKQPAQAVSAPKQARRQHNQASIAILPFKDMGGGAGDEIFADGIVEELAMVLSSFHTLFVLGASTSRMFRGSALPIPTIARELGVKYILEGSIRRAGGRVRISVVLVDGDTGAQVWADRFDDSLEDVFELQDRIANTVASKIDATIEAAEARRAVERPTGSPNAYELFLRANAATMSWDREDMSRAIDAAQEALKLDPKFAWAAIVLSMCHAVFYHSQWGDEPEAHREEAHRYLNLALRLRHDDPYVLAHGAGALVAMGEDLPTAQRLIDRGLELNSGSALTRLYAGWVAIAAGKFEDGLEHFEESLRLDPHSARRYALLSGKGLCLLGLGRLEEAHAVLAESERLAPDHTPATLGLTLCAAAMGRIDEAQRSATRLQPASVAHRSLAVLQDATQRESMEALLATVLESAQKAG
jgi:adenylate cyclase